MRLITLLLVSVLLLAAAGLQAQEAAGPHGKSPDFRHHRLALLIGHTHVPATLDEPNGLFIPSWGLDYEYWFSHRWAVGLHTDLELQTFIVESGENNESIEREYPLVATLDLLFRPWRGLVLELGPGYEFEKTENLFVVRAGLSYEVELPDHWDLAPTFFYDTRAEAFDTYTLGLVVGKRF